MERKSSSHGGAARDVCPDFGRTRSGCTVLVGGNHVAPEVKEVIDPVVGREEALPWRDDLNRSSCRSRRRVGSRTFSARLFNPMCCRCPTESIMSFFAAP